MRRSLLPLVIALCVFPLAFAQLYTRTYFTTRAGEDLEAQRLTMLGVPWFKPEYRQFVRRLKERLPADTALLVEPSSVAQDEPPPGSRTRWFLYLANDLYPLRVFVRDPKNASGTLVDYPTWVDLHFEQLDLDGSGLDLGGILRREQLQRADDAALDARHVEWKLTYPISTRFRIRDLGLARRTAEGDWLPLDLDIFLAEGREAAL